MGGAKVFPSPTLAGQTTKAERAWPTGRGKARQTAAKLIRKPSRKSRLGLAGSLMKNLEIYGQRVVKAAPLKLGPSREMWENREIGGKRGARSLPIVSETPSQTIKTSHVPMEWATGGLNK